MMMIHRYHNILKILQIFVVSFLIIAPFIITSNGHNLIRVDLYSKDIYFFNNIITLDEFFNTSLVILLSVFLFVLFTQIFGRFWCGWLCPQSFFLNNIRNISNKIKKRNIKKVVDILLSGMFALAFTLILFFYIVSPYDFVRYITESSYNYIGITILIILSIVLFIDFAFVKYSWCKHICPYSKLQSVMIDDSTFYIGMIKDEESKCINCLSCVKKCPIKIDPRKTPNNSCIYCGICIESCEKVLSKRGKSSIIGYNFGIENKFKFIRSNLLITLAISILLLTILIYNIFYNQPLELKLIDLKKIDNNSIMAKLNIENNTSLNNIVRVYTPSDEYKIQKGDVFSIYPKKSCIVEIIIVHNDILDKDFNLTCTFRNNKVKSIQIKATTLK